MKFLEFVTDQVKKVLVWIVVSLLVGVGLTHLPVQGHLGEEVHRLGGWLFQMTCVVGGLWLAWQGWSYMTTVESKEEE
jgi:hypothetical protein